MLEGPVLGTSWSHVLMSHGLELVLTDFESTRSFEMAAEESTGLRSGIIGVL